MQLLIGFLLIATIAGMFTRALTTKGYVLGLAGAVIVSGLYYTSSGMW